YRILADRSGKPLRQIIRDTKRNDFYLDAARAKDYGLIDGILGPVQALLRDSEIASLTNPSAEQEAVEAPDVAAAERPPEFSE
ncbi:MAG: ATP-dependent Clp protease proteolytic subunit, partial [Acidobacteriota bacterium]|nr:ATP-dependent Clp protease proteolytic subunit [Acidobacteriota bacterium]